MPASASTSVFASAPPWVRGTAEPAYVRYIISESSGIVRAMKGGWTEYNARGKALRSWELADPTRLWVNSEATRAVFRAEGPPHAAVFQAICRYIAKRMMEGTIIEDAVTAEMKQTFAARLENISVPDVCAITPYFHVITLQSEVPPGAAACSSSGAAASSNSPSSLATDRPAMITIKWGLASEVAQRIVQTIQEEGGYYHHDADPPGPGDYDTLRALESERRWAADAPGPPVGAGQTSPTPVPWNPEQGPHMFEIIQLLQEFYNPSRPAWDLDELKKILKHVPGSRGGHRP